MGKHSKMYLLVTVARKFPHVMCSRSRRLGFCLYSLRFPLVIAASRSYVIAALSIRLFIHHSRLAQCMNGVPGCTVFVTQPPRLDEQYCGEF